MDLSRRAFAPRPAPSLPAGQRIFAIGDIHGCADLLDRLTEQIDAYNRAYPCRDPLLVFLGDYIDRGPDSAGVIDRLRRADFSTEIVTLRGNHEQLLLDALADEDAFDNWAMNGGDATVLSYAGQADLDRANEDVGVLIPGDHIDFFRATTLSFSAGDYFFCHAGIRPGVAFDRQAADDLLWIRKPFHASTEDFGKVVVHGHTPVSDPESLPNRINVDTGAFKSGVLTCVVLEGTSRRFMSAQAR